jgi:hypothetical protein
MRQQAFVGCGIRSWVFDVRETVKSDPDRLGDIRGAAV